MTSKKMYLLFRKSVFLSHHTTVEEDGPVSYFSLITSNKLVIARQPRAVCQIFLFLIYCCYFTRLKAGLVNIMQTLRNSESTCHIALGTVR